MSTPKQPTNVKVVATTPSTRLAAIVQSAAPFTDAVIAAALLDGWGLGPEELAYAAVGYGSWHWYARSAAHGRLFVTVDQVASDAGVWTKTNPHLGDLEWAYGVPLAVVRAGMPFARPPLPTITGRVLAAIDERWVVSVWPLIDGRASHDGTYSSRDDAAAVLAILRVLHDVPIPSFGEATPRRETFRLSGTARLLDLVDQKWPGPHVGPHAAAAERLLHRHAKDIHALAVVYDDLVHRAPPAHEWVVTHGEPHAANVVFTDQRPVLIDWDTTKVAPRERDLWMIAADGFSVGDADQEMLRLYRAQWDLGELSDYAGRFADPHDDGPEGDRSWDDFTQYVYRAAHI